MDEELERLLEEHQRNLQAAAQANARPQQQVPQVPQVQQLSQQLQQQRQQQQQGSLPSASPARLLEQALQFTTPSTAALVSGNPALAAQLQRMQQQQQQLRTPNTNQLAQQLLALNGQNALQSLANRVQLTPNRTAAAQSLAALRNQVTPAMQPSLEQQNRRAMITNAFRNFFATLPRTQQMVANQFLQQLSSDRISAERFLTGIRTNLGEAVSQKVRAIYTEIVQKLPPPSAAVTGVPAGVASLSTTSALLASSVTSASFSAPPNATQNMNGLSGLNGLGGANFPVPSTPASQTPAAAAAAPSTAQAAKRKPTVDPSSSTASKKPKHTGGKETPTVPSLSNTAEEPPQTPAASLLATASSSLIATSAVLGAVPETPSNNPFAFPLQSSQPPRPTPILPATTAPAESTGNDVDVTKMDSNSLQDIVQYAGVDLKEEAELLMRNAEEATAAGYTTGMQSHALDQVLVSPGLSAAVNRIAKAEGLAMDPMVIAYLSLALAERLRTLIERSVRASKARVECGRDTWQLQLADGAAVVESAPSGTRSRVGAVKRPLVWLERSERVKEGDAAKLVGSSLTEEGRQALIDSGMAVEDEDKEKKKGKKGEEVLSKEELAIRTRLANVTAMKAAGVSSGKYSWMTTGASASAGAKSALGAINSTPAPDNGGGDAAASSMPPPSAPSKKQDVGSGGFGLPRPSVRRRVLNSRRVSLKDLMFALKQDRSRGGNWGVLRRSPAVGRGYSVRLSNDR